ncbi:thioredoxin domain-containing protein [Fluviicola sp.]|uniref:thioredoxin family protein n=1 Tax=Fluviicola sp. TaxID=1917219 RepID=UPI002635E271|nr:thioredoxin domain-containing protein [Fluviicola sp.]
MKFPIVLFLGISLLLFSFHTSKEESAMAASGIKFTKIPFEKAVKQAQSSGKLIFIDVHTSWCGPCKEMAKTTFQDSEVGKEFNKRFINLKIDAEKDADGPMISKAYTVSGYPTLLFINGEGKLVRKLVGKQSKEKLLAAISAIK